MRTTPALAIFDTPTSTPIVNFFSTFSALSMKRFLLWNRKLMFKPNHHNSIN